MKKLLIIAVIATSIVVLGFIAICVLSFISMGYNCIIPVVMCAMLFGTGLMIIWDDSELKAQWKQHLLTCDSVLPSNI